MRVYIQLDWLLCQGNNSLLVVPVSPIGLFAAHQCMRSRVRGMTCEARLSKAEVSYGAAPRCSANVCLPVFLLLLMCVCPGCGDDQGAVGDAYPPCSAGGWG